MSLTVSVQVCGPVLGPLVGGFAVESGSFRGHEPWTWTIFELLWLSGFCLIFLFFFLPETSSTNILHRRTARLRKLTGDKRLTCEPDMMSEHMGPKDVRWWLLASLFFSFVSNIARADRTHEPRKAYNS